MQKIFIIIILLTLCGITQTKGGGFKIGLQGNKQIGIGHTGVGFAQDAGTIYFNPAGMGFVKNQLSGNVFFLAPSISFLESKTNILTEATGQVFSPFSVYATKKIGKKLSLGIGAYTPFGSGVMYPSEWTGRYILTRINLNTIYIQPTASLKLTESLAVGLGYVIARGNILLEKDLPISTTQEFAPYASLTGKGKGTGYNMGVYYQNKKNIALGITYHSKVKMNLENGDARFYNIPTALSSSFPAKNKFSSTITLPAELGIGTSFKIHKNTTLAFDFNQTYWSSYDSLGFDYATNTSAVTDAKSPRMYKNATAFRGGIESKVFEDVTLRIGGFIDHTPIADEYVAPELPDNDKTGLTCGATYTWRKNLTLDCSVLYENVKQRTTKNTETGFAGTYKAKAVAVGFGFNYYFGKVQKRSKRYTPRFSGNI